MAKCAGCGYCCTHFIIPMSCGDKYRDEDVRDLMAFIRLHGPEGQYETARTLNGFLLKDNQPCRYYDTETHKCTVHGTKKQPKLCQEGFCDRARGRGDDKDAYVTEDVREIVQGAGEWNGQ